MNTFGVGVLVGVILGAAAAEFTRKRRPECMDKIREKIQSGVESVKSGVAAMKTAFDDGYQKAKTAV